MGNLITSERKTYFIKTKISPTCIQSIVFLTGWQMICFLSNINAEAQKN